VQALNVDLTTLASDVRRAAEAYTAEMKADASLRTRGVRRCGLHSRRRTTGCRRLHFRQRARPVTLCSQGESRKSNTSPVPRATPYIPLDCEVDWLCTKARHRSSD
jgi:hypothetical protein